jgi:hypothetical protein
MLHPDGAGHRTMLYTIATEPAFIGVENDGWLFFLRIGDKDIGTADIHARKTSRAEFRVYDNILARG